MRITAEYEPRAVAAISVSTYSVYLSIKEMRRPNSILSVLSSTVRSDIVLLAITVRQIYGGGPVRSRLCACGYK